MSARAYSSSLSTHLLILGASGGLATWRKVTSLLCSLPVTQGLVTALGLAPLHGFTKDILRVKSLALCCPACFSGPLRERLLRYYAETADQVKRLLRVTANGKAQNRCQSS